MDLYEWLQEEAKTHFIQDYVDSSDREKIAAETLGIKIAQHCQWDGEQVAHFLVRAICSGLEDANWHTEAGFFFDWADRLDHGEQLHELLEDPS